MHTHTLARSVLLYNDDAKVCIFQGFVHVCRLFQIQIFDPQYPVQVLVKLLLADLVTPLRFLVRGCNLLAGMIAIFMICSRSWDSAKQN